MLDKRVVFLLSAISLATAVPAAWDEGRYKNIDNDVGVRKTINHSYGSELYQKFNFHQPDVDLDENTTDTTEVLATITPSAATRAGSGSDPASEARPLIILAPAGAFIDGDKDELYLEVMAERYAQYGYTVATISYKTTTVSNFNDSGLLSTAAQAIQDMNTAVRYFMEYSTEWGIDPEFIYIGGISAGAITALGAAFLDPADITHMPELHKNLINNVGLLGQQHGGYKPRVAGVISLSGAVYRDIEQGYNIFINNNGAPTVLALHSRNDPEVPYRCDFLKAYGIPIISSFNLCGGSYIERKLGSRLTLGDRDGYRLTLKTQGEPVGRVHIDYYAFNMITASNPCSDYVGVIDNITKDHICYGATQQIIDKTAPSITKSYLRNKQFSNRLTRTWERYGDSPSYPAVSKPNIIMLEDGQSGKTALVTREEANDANSVTVSFDYGACSTDELNTSSSLSVQLGATKSEYEDDKRLSSANSRGLKNNSGVYFVISKDSIALYSNDDTLLEERTSTRRNCRAKTQENYQFTYRKSDSPSLIDQGTIAIQWSQNGSVNQFSYQLTDAVLASKLGNGSVAIIAVNTMEASSEHIISNLLYETFK